MKNDLRISLTRRMLKDGLIRTMAHKTLSKITVTELCKESGVNRTTFYNHYETPVMVLKDIAEDYAAQLNRIYHEDKLAKKYDERQAIEACLEYLYARKDEIKILLSKNAENSISGFGLDIVNESLKRNTDKLPMSVSESPEDAFLCAIITASASYGLISTWLAMDIDKSPKEIVDLLIGTFGRKYFYNVSTD